MSGAERPNDGSGTPTLPRGSSPAVPLSHTTRHARRAFGALSVRGWLMPVLALTAVAALVSCSDDKGAAGATDSLSQATPTAGASTVSAQDQDVLAAYRAFWDAYLKAADPMDPASADLAAHATGSELETVRTAFIARQSGNEAIRGTLDLAPRVVSVVGDTAGVRDCYLDNTGIF